MEWKEYLGVVACLTAVASVSGCAETGRHARGGYPRGADLLAVCGNHDGEVGRLSGPVFALSRETRSLPDFAKLQEPPTGGVCLSGLDINERNGPPGFPGVTSRYEWFGVDLSGAFTVTEAGLFQFRLTNDDGAKLIIDGRELIDNDGYHPTRFAEVGVGLSAGVHHIGVPYWQGPGPLTLILDVARQGQPYHLFHLDQPL